jgi:hypothetical protein
MILLFLFLIIIIDLVLLAWIFIDSTKWVYKYSDDEQKQPSFQAKQNSIQDSIDT